MGMCKFFSELLELLSSSVEEVAESRHIFVGASCARDLPIIGCLKKKQIISKM